MNIIKTLRKLFLNKQNKKTRRNIKKGGSKK